MILDYILYNQQIKKILNYLLSQPLFFLNPFYLQLQQIKIKKIIKKYKNKPFALRIENTNYCNGRCFMCPHSTMKRQQGTMSVGLYKKIIDNATKIGIDFINLHNFGEPLIDRDFVWRVEYAKSKGIKKITTNTNGLLLTSKLSNKIVKSGLDEIYVSLDAYTSSTYDKIRIGLDFKTVNRNINRLIKVKTKLKSLSPKIVVDFLESDINHHETNRFINKWQKKVDHVCISQIHDWSEKIKTSQKISYDNYVGYSQSPCRLPFTEMTINWDGTVSLCCQDIEGEVLIGNVKHQTIRQIWQSKKIKSIRQHHLNLNTDRLKLCSKCKLRTFWWTF